ncbi:AraC family transcriptional regulator ligand-binding domain-containing protein (plasmid) [Ensifer adhaerens]|uniref:AraC family transcriptional regulator n=1 Tax=Ensifer adhaerens TaxID=106592 RepID=UPI0023A9E362|nr:AraC family transcriptional regulator [Ensifer adhaerens]WDZ80414.1 AraC family transcriptional regulator ligand-binding domain-containing protein [Ensifer adhaerens]
MSGLDLANRKRINTSSQIKFLGKVSRACGDDWLGLTLAKDFDLREMGVLFYAAASSSRLGDALLRIERYARVANEALTIQIARVPNCHIGFGYTGTPRQLNRHQIEFTVLVLLRLCREIVGQSLAPLRVSFVHHRSGDLRNIRELLGCDVEFDAYADELEFDAAAADLPLAGDDQFLNELMVQMCEDAISIRATNASTLRTLVENTVAPLLPHAEATAKTVARRLGLSERSLARRLADEELSFGEILDELRRDLAVRYLEEEHLQASQIAWLLGFHQPSSFTHAFRRWTGKSPSEFRISRGSFSAAR